MSDEIPELPELKLYQKIDLVGEPARSLVQTGMKAFQTAYPFMVELGYGEEFNIWYQNLREGLGLPSAEEFNANVERFPDVGTKPIELPEAS